VNLAGIARQTERFVINNSPVILTAIGVTGVLTTALLVGKASFKASELIRDEQLLFDKHAPIDAYYGPTEKFHRVWRLYVPAAGTAALTIAAIICANRISARRAAALAAAFSISERAFEEYQSKVVERMGERKEVALRDELAQERLNRDPVSKREVIIAGTGEVLCYDAYTGRYFLSSMETLKKAQNEINYKVTHGHFVSLTDYYDLIGLPSTTVSEEVGWNLDKLLELSISTGLSDDDRPCLVMNFEVTPSRSNFRKP
jgi:hypothetical protein